jgi:predicted DsbA family dithiol-disulfide isomerase
VNVEIWSDVVCPWCYVGKRRFEAALARFPHAGEVEVVWRSFELDPRAARETDRDLHTVLAAKLGGDRARALALNAHVTNQAAAVGLAYDLDHAHPTNSFDAHRLIHLAAAHGLQDAAEECLFAAYFTEARHIGRPDTLQEIGTAIGLDAQEVAEMLAGDACTAAVRADEAEARALGITGVPFFVINRKYGISGAQPSAVFLETLQTIWREDHPLTMLGGTSAGATGDPACVDDACAVPVER